jgi:tetratricopeptide (TPR) repeat protein
MRRLSLVIGMSAGAVVCLPSMLWAQCATPLARVVAVDNSVQIKAASAANYAPATLNAPVCQGDAIRVGDTGRATIVFVDTGLRLTIEQNTEFIISPPKQPGRSFIELVRGAIIFFTRQRPLDVHTPFVNAAVEGTEFLIRFDGIRTDVGVLDGAVTMSTGQGVLTLTGGQSGFAVAGQAPQRIDVRPADAVSWALYYEPVLETAPVAQLDQVAVADRDARYFVRRASTLLNAGRVDEALADLGRATQLNPNDSDALALSAVIDVAQNRRDEALEQGRRAVSLAPQSLSARLALSYALQANFELAAARDQLEAVVPADRRSDRPEHALVLARLAELWLSLGYLDRARDAATRAAAVAPDHSRALTVLGFTELARLRTSDAKAAFERAIGNEARNPLAYLGLGLTKIRNGDLSGGRQDIETAAALDVGDAVIRSYLGKAYFEERRDSLSAEQLALAKQQDPRDPTPYLYDAIRKQTVNRPIEALEDLQKSIELNDNRAVYRSRFLLDSDLAARSASLGRIYRDLGFEQQAVVEGWKSLAWDAGDFSGHRFLADVYSVLPRHEVARVSEVLQAQLLQPLNVAPVSPRLAETDLFILPGGGPGEPGFEEFNSLFVRNRMVGRVTGVVGERSVLGDEATVSGVWRQLSFSAGQFHYDTEGVRENNDQDRDIYNAFVQARLSPSTSIQGEFRSHDSSTGDLNLLFNSEDFSRDERIVAHSKLGRVGFRHVFSPRSQVIASIYGAHDTSDATSSIDQVDEHGHAASLSETDSGTAEVRHFFRSHLFNVTTGAGHFQSTRKRTETLDLDVPFPPFVLNFADEFNDDPRHTNLYSYASVEGAKVAVTFGASGDFYKSRLLSRNQFNPKVGVIWTPQPRTTLRVAAFRTLQRTLVASQTIEPTEIAGFNQFFADKEGEAAWRYGVAIDHKLNHQLFGGVEYSWRTLTVPIEIVRPSGETDVFRFARSEQLGRGYAHWVKKSVAVSGEYLFERFDRDSASSGAENILKLRTHRVPVGIRYFRPQGWIVTGMATFISQTGEFAAEGFAPTGQDRFWVVDGTFGYRFPKRYGLLAFEVKNLFDEQFQFQDTDPGNPVVKPGRIALLTFTLGL